jgi:hypothetical protein
VQFHSKDRGLTSCIWQARRAARRRRSRLPKLDSVNFPVQHSVSAKEG